MAILLEGSAARHVAPAPLEQGGRSEGEPRGKTGARARTATGAAAASRFPAIDAVRLLAACAVAWVHTVQSPELAPTISLSRYGTPFFTAVAVFLLFQSSACKPGRDFGSYAWARVRRLTVPFVAWSAIYYAGSAAHRALFGGGPPEPLSWGHLLYGVPAQLWFLQYLLILLMACFPLARLATRLSGRRSAAGLAALCGALVAAGVAAGLSPAPVPDWADARARGFIESGWSSFPAALWGAAIAASYARWPAAARRSGWLALAGAALFVAGQSLAWPMGPLPLIKCAAGVGCVLVAIAPLAGAACVAAGRAGGYSFGIYVAHVMVIETVQAAARAAGLGATWQLDLATLPLAIVGSIAVVKALRLTRATAWLVP